MERAHGGLGRWPTSSSGSIMDQRAVRAIEMRLGPGDGTASLSQESLKVLGRREARVRGRKEEEREGARPQHGEVEMWRWSGYLMAGG